MLLAATCDRLQTCFQLKVMSLSKVPLFGTLKSTHIRVYKANTFTSLSRTHRQLSSFGTECIACSLPLHLNVKLLADTRFDNAVTP